MTMKHHSACFLIAVPVLLICAGTGCNGGNGGRDGDGDELDLPGDEPADEDTRDAVEEDPGVEEDAAQEDAPAPPPLDRALLVDAELMHHAAWIDMEEAADSAGISLEYRRFYPHVTEADTAGEDRYPLIMVAAGSAPGMASSRLSVDEIDTLSGYVESGGILILMPQPTRLDSYYGENDWFVMNRLLEALESSMRIERGSLLGPLFLGSPDPPHLDDDTGYATLLEFDIGYAWAYPVADTPLDGLLDGPVPAGRGTVLRTRGDEVAVLLYAPRGSNLWIRTEGGTIGEQIRSIVDRRPVAAVERIGSGLLAVVPRFLATLGGAGGQVSEHPANSTGTIERNSIFLRWLTSYLRSLHEGGEELVPVDPSGGDDELFRVSSPSIPPAGPGEVIPVAYEPSARPVASEPPEGRLHEDFVEFDPDGDRPETVLFGGAKGKIGYGGMPWDAEGAGTVFAEAAAMGLDAVVGGFTPERLVTGELTPEEEETMREAMGVIAAAAEEEDVGWLVGSYYTGHVYNSNPSAFPRSVGAQRQTYDAPPLLHEPLWDDYLIPAAVEVAVEAAGRPGIAGILVDMEMYGTVLTYTDAQAFDDATFDVYLHTVSDPELRDLLEMQTVETRLDTLIERGLLADYLDALFAGAAEIGARYREAVSSVDPDFAVAIYLPNIPVCWQYRGLIRGLGTEDSPVIILTYDPYSIPCRADLVAGGSFALHLGGPIVSHFPPADLTNVLENCAGHTDGFWYFSHDEISANASSDPVFGSREEYRAAVAAAAAGL